MKIRIPPVFSDLSARGGLPFALFGLGMAAAMIWHIYADLRQVLWYKVVTGVVTKFTPPDKAARRIEAEGRIDYSYSFKGKTYPGTFQGKGIHLPHDVGAAINVAVDPAQPSISTADPRVNPFWFVLLLFAMPFAYTGLAWQPEVRQSPWYKLRLGRRAIQWKGKGPNEAFLWPYALLSALGSAGLLLVFSWIPWQAACTIGLVLLLAIPVLTKLLGAATGLHLDPNQSMLERELPLSYWFLVGLLLMFVLGGFVLLWATVRARHNYGMFVLHVARWRAQKR